MSKTNTSEMQSVRELKVLRKEVETLKKQFSKVQKFMESAKKPGKVRATKAVVNAIDVVDATGKVVASIDDKGNLFCLTVWASTGKNTRGVFLNGNAGFRKVSAGALELIGTNGNTPALDATSFTGAGNITLRDLNSTQRLLLQGSGSPLLAYDDKSGALAVSIASNVPAGGQIVMSGTTKGSKAKATLSVSHLTGAGAVYLEDSQGQLVGRLP